MSYIPASEHSAIERLRARNMARDARWSKIKLVRDGQLEQVFPGAFSDEWPKSVVANFIDVAARDMAESLAQMPALNCHPGSRIKDSAKKFASRKTRIGHYYWELNQLAQQLVTAADQYSTYGVMPIVVEPDYDKMCPRMRFEDPRGTYFEQDRWLQTRLFVKVTRERRSALQAMFPELAGALMDDRDNRFPGNDSDPELEVIRFSDADSTAMYVPDRKNLILSRKANLVSRCPVSIAARPGLDREIRGQFDDVIWVQMARTKMAMLAIEGAEKAIRAPISVPDDMNDFPLGSDAIWKTRNPEKIRRVNLELGPTTFQEGALLQNEMRLGARYPEARSGTMDQSVVTGRGVQALLSQFDSQIKTGQTMIGGAIADATSLCFEMDEKEFPNVHKTIRGSDSGTPYEEKYVPKIDINGDYTAEVSYGFAAGQSPATALVMLLQLRGDELIDRNTVRKSLPFDINVDEMERSLHIEKTRDALAAGVAATLQSMGIMAAQGQDPTMLLTQTAKLIKGIESGKNYEDLVIELFAKPEPSAADLAAGGGAPGGSVPGIGADGLLNGVAPGQAGMPPGGLPDLNTLLAGIGSQGQPQLSAGVQRRIPA